MVDTLNMWRNDRRIAGVKQCEGMVIAVTFRDYTEDTEVTDRVCRAQRQSRHSTKNGSIR